jgi:hypothetical protein
MQIVAFSLWERLNMSWPKSLHAYLVGFSLLLAAVAGAQEEPKPIEPAPAAEREQPAREQTIYIPYNKLRQIFEKEGRGVFVPYDEFQRLWKAARDAAKKIEETKPPVAALIEEIESQATVSRDAMTVSAKLKIEVLSEGWHHLYLRLKDAVVHSAKIGDRPARLISEADKGYWVLLEKKGKDPEKIELLLEYSKPFSKEPGTNHVEFDAPQAAVNRWQIRIPEPGVKVKIEPNVSAETETMGPGDGATAADPKKETLVHTAVGAADKVRIEWTAKAEGAAGLAALVTVQSRQEVTIDEGVVHTRTTLAYDIQRADVTQLTVEVPADHNVVNVFDPNIQKWEKKTEGPIQTLTISLFQPTRGNQNVLIELEKFAGDKEMPQEMTHAEIRAPVVRAVQAGTVENMSNIGRQQGVVVVRLGTSLRGEATSRTGLLQVDLAELPAPLARQPWTFAYRYAALPFDLLLSVEKLLPLVEVEELAEVYLEPNQITADLLAVFNVQRAGIFQIELEVPEGYEVRSVQGREAAGAAAAVVDSHHLEDVEYTPDPAQPDVKAKRRTKLVVALGRRALGKVGIWVELVKRQDDPNLLQPTGTASTVTMPHPRVAPSSVARTSGKLLIYAPESLRANPQEAKGLAPISPAEAVANLGCMRGGRFPQLREVAAYGYTQEAVSLTFSAERRKPYIEARLLLAVHVESGVIRYEATLFFDVKYSGVRTVRLDVPSDIAGDLRNLTSALRDQRIEPQPADVAEGYVAWQLAGEGELLGAATAKFSWEKKLGELPVGTAVAIDLPQLKVVGGDRFWGQIAVSKAESIEISVKDEPKGLRPIDPQRDWMPGVSVPNAARAFEFHEDWTLGLAATRYQLEEVKRTSIDRALVRMVVTRGQQVAVQALYRLRSARQRVPLKIPGVDPKNTAGVLDARPLKINNQPAALEHDGTQFFIPLVGHTADEPVLVELRYTVPGNPSSLELPEFPDDPAVQQVYVAAYLPSEWKLLSVGGPWTNESVVGIGVPSIETETRGPPPTDDELLSRVRDGVASCDHAGSDFPLDGTRHLFSTLRPEAGTAGALRLTTAHRNVINAAVFLIVAIVGLLLTPRPTGTRLWWLASLVVGIVLVAVFAPTLAKAVLATPLWLAIGLTLLVWTVRYLAWFIPSCVAWCSSRFPRAVATPVVVAPAAATEGGQAHA